MKKWLPALALTAIICALLASSGVAQSAIQATRVLIVDSTNTAVTPSVDATDNTAAQTTGPQVFGVASSAAPTVAGADGRSKSIWIDLNGRVHVTGDASMSKLLVTPDSVALPANQSVNVAQINGVTPLMGTGNTGTGAQRVTISTDQVALNGMGVGATGAAPPANANYFAGITSGATGGLLSAGVPVCDSQAFLDMTTATTTEIVALTSGRTIHICHIRAVANGTTVMTFKRGTGTNCGTGTAAIDAAYDLTAQTGFSAGSGFGEVLSGNTSANAVCVTSSAAVNLHVFVRYAVY